MNIVKCSEKQGASLEQKKYKLKYLPIFASDLTEAVTYISNVLHNPQAAERLVNDTENAIMERLHSPLSYQPYQSAKKRKHTYYRINIRNFSVFYVVIDDVMEVRRFIYSKRDIYNIL